MSGASTAVLLLRENPGLRVLIVEKSKQFSRRVGEATVEISSYFMGRVLGMTQYLNEHHLAKQGLRYWFANKDVANLGEASELGGRYQVRLPSYLIDRSTFDEEVLRRACDAGAELLRPAAVSDVQLSPGAVQTITLKTNDTVRTITARWVVDASGVAALLARKNGWFVSNEAHPTAAAWSRWKGVKDWDSLELGDRFPEWSQAVYGIRGTATNHITGDGWWSWWIPLKGGDVSVGVVFDQRLVHWPQDGKVGDRLREFLMKHPVAREMLAQAEYDQEDVHWRKNLAYSSTTLAGDGFVLVGDAAAFLDPFYSPGMDWISFTASAAADLIAAERRGEAMPERIARLNRDYGLSYRSWFDAVYRDKYEYLGEFDLMSLSLILDLGLYYLGIASQPYKLGPKALLIPPFSERVSRPFYHLIRTYNRRFAQIARRRRRLGLLGRKNRGRRCLIGGFTLKPTDVGLIVRALSRWLWLELTEGWHSWIDRAPRVTANSELSAPLAPTVSAPTRG
ncbi:MAG: tryptophan 7-halogenase [Chthoniobacterales bacterium]|nr:tryptophan 7-halogenase [Chthoniobacterales bacterium]